MDRVLYHASNLEHWVDVAEIMQDRHDWKPVYWIGSESLEENVKSSFPNLIYHYKKSGARSVGPDKYQDSFQYPLSKKEIAHQAHEQHISIKMMDRMDPSSIFDYDQRLRNHLRLLMYWKNVICEEDIERVIFELPPHVIIDYVLYIACKQMDVETIMLKEAISLPAFVYSQSSIGELPKGFHESGADTNIPDEISGYVNDIEKTKSGNEFSYPTSENHTAIRDLITDICDIIPKPHDIQDNLPQKRIKRPGTDIEDSEYSVLEYKMMKVKNRFDRWKLKKEYRKKSTTVDLSRNYIYFPLHYQPELTTSPQGDIFVHQFLAANLLSCSLPSDYKLYIKEHPLQFKKGERGRKTYHYRNLLKLDSVELVEMEMDQIELIDNADIVSTLTGTSGWEAVVRSTPVIVFGNAWYRGCDGVFHVQSQKDILDVISSVEDEFNISRHQIDEFLHKLTSVGFQGYVLKSGRKSADWIKRSENISGIVNQLEMYT